MAFIQVGPARELQSRADRAWNLVAVGFVISLLSTGVRFAIGPFFEHMLADFGFSRTFLSGVVGAGMLVYGLAMPFAGRLADRLGGRTVLTGGALMVAASLALTGWARSGAVFAVAYGFLASVGFAATSPVVMTPLIARWFQRRRGLAMTILTAGSMGGIAVMTPLAAVLVSTLGWRETYFLVGAAFIAVLVPGVLVLVPRNGGEPVAASPAVAASASPAPVCGPAVTASASPAPVCGPAVAPPAADAGPLPGGGPDLPEGIGAGTGTAGERGRPPGPGPGPGPGSSPSWVEAVYTLPFWYLAAGFFGCGFSMNLLGTHGVPMLHHHGFSVLTASSAIGVLGLVSIFGSVTLGAVSDRYGRRSVLALIYMVRGLGFLALVFLGHEWELYAVAALGGLVWAGSSALTSTLTADIFGVDRAGILAGMVYVSHQLGAAAGSFLGGWGFETMGSYMLPFTAAAVLLLAGAWFSLRLPGRRPAAGTAAAAAGDQAGLLVTSGQRIYD